MSRLAAMSRTLDGFRHLRGIQRMARLQRMRELVTEWRRQGLPRPPKKDGLSARERLNSMAVCVREFEELTERLRRERPPSFSLFEMFRATNDELTHSRLLAWLLDPRGSHHERHLFLSAFVDLIGLEVTEDELCRCRVVTEATHDESRIDIMLYCRGGFLIFLENKVWSAEGQQQTARELRDMRRVGLAIGVPLQRQRAIYLTPFGRRPSSVDHSSWLCVSHGRVARRFGQAVQEARHPRVRTLVEDWIRTVSRWR